MSKAKILVVDDNGSLKTAREILAHEKFDVLHADSGEEALELLESEDPALVVSSFHLSGMSGADLLSELHEWDSSLPVILIGEGGEEKDWLEAVQANAVALFSKRIKKDSFLKAVHRAIQEKQTLSAF